jgi:allophanate hydrolase
VIGIPSRSQLEFFGCKTSRLTFETEIGRLEQNAARIVEIDFTPFREVAQMIYDGPWMAERYDVIRSFIETKPQAMHPVTYKAISSSTKFTAADAFAAEHRLMELKRLTGHVWDEIDVLVTPTVPRTYKIKEVLEKPFELNTIWRTIRIS